MSALRGDYKSVWNSLSGSKKDAYLVVSGYTDEDKFHADAEDTIDILRETVGVRPDDTFLEIGPGYGALTRPLAERVARMQRAMADDAGGAGDEELRGGRPASHARPREGGASRAVLGRVAVGRDLARVLHRLRPLAGVSNQAEERRRQMYERDPVRAFITDPSRTGRQFQAALDEAEGRGSTERRYLTDPPSQYRQPAETAQSEFDDIERKRRGNVFTRLFGG